MNKLKTLLVSSMVGLVVAGCGGTSSAPISGTLKGLSTGTTLQLLNNGVNPIVLSANGVFTFSISISAGSTYNVTIGTQPIGETCTVTNGTGTVNSSGSGVTNVAVNCVASTNSNNIVLGQLSGLPAGSPDSWPKTILLLLVLATQFTATFVTPEPLELTVPVPFVTVQVSPIGCVPIVTL